MLFDNYYYDTDSLFHKVSSSDDDFSLCSSLSSSPIPPSDDELSVSSFADLNIEDYSPSSSPVQIDDSLTLEDLRSDNNFDDPHDAFQSIFKSLCEQASPTNKPTKRLKKERSDKHQQRKIRHYEPYLMHEAEVNNTFEKIFLAEGHLLDVRFIIQNKILKVHAGDVMSLFINRQNVSREIFSIIQTNDPVYKTFMNMHWVPVSFVEEWIARKRKITPFLSVYKQLIKFMKKENKKNVKLQM